MTMTPREALLRARALGWRGVVLLESLGPVTADARYTLMSAAPRQVVSTLPERPAGSGLFPAWLGGLKYEGARDLHLPAHAASGPAQLWGLYPSGLVWDRAAGTLEVVGEAHVDWAALRRAPAAPEPTLRVGAFSADDVDFPAGVRAVQDLIRAGEVYQVNLSRGVQASAHGDPLAAYLHLRDVNPSPFMAYAELGEDEVVVSGSPERLVLWADGQVSARPIAGTRRRGDTPEEDAALEAELRHDPKEVAEHVMLVDLVRHDLGAVAASGSVRVPDLMLVERYSHVMHLVSEVVADAAPDLTVRDVLAATFPGGTITGAPKRRVMQAIRDLEPGPRGWYTGGLGVLSGARVDVNILIRTAGFTRAGEGWTVTVRSGAGVVIDSDPAAEARETMHKAQALLSVLGGLPGRPPRAPQPPVHGRAWAPPAAPDRVPARVLLLDNFDSFTHNLRHDLLALGADVDVRAHTAALEELLALGADAVLIGPGPGTPRTSGVTLPLVQACLNAGVPLLGVCLGHQALGEVLGGTVTRAGVAVHGKPEAVAHDGQGVFAGLPRPAAFTRYHSLVVRDLPADAARVTATSADGEIMGLSAAHAPAWGVQFHPESVLSAHGRALLANWLRLARRA
ncbi:aminodeoxychorismate components I/II [Deinococcus maricopensis]|uniref:Glutamine amidotransferase of anthranilate synthase n=1 Tax=Deinococcus maricopensis (strain DSM 21211 / LMG 22137 / NRRL B-23946 / LB-34) TaxID=709986 RepID=E8U797_DEIML|nr:aminodeoxychorismate components I/II [Deinococcus maricopensis]ADV66936.1 glutamine amidotransferase of anthranilate synthase [Deinococcus maricopensis DSM 21211]